VLRQVALFFAIRGVVERVVLETQKTVTAKWYTEECLHRVVQAMRNIRPRSRADTWFLHHDNAPAHRSKVCTEYLTSSRLKVLEHPSYSPNLALFDFALFPYMKIRLKRDGFPTTRTL
jgi:hypothetical protein